jgi:hypothetical protein
VGTVLTGNTFTDSSGNTVVQLIRSVADTALTPPVASLTYVTDQVNVKVTVDATSTVVLTDSGGHAFNLAGVSGLATTAGTGSSTLTLTQANIGSNTVQVLPSTIQATTNSGTASVRLVSGTEWQTTASSSTQTLTYTLTGLAANTTYTIKKNGVTLGTFTTDAHGVLTFSEVAGSLSAVDYTIG